MAITLTPQQKRALAHIIKAKKGRIPEATLRSQLLHWFDRHTDHPQDEAERWIKAATK